MLGFAGSSMALFAVVWSLMCVVSAALVTDAMLRDGAVAHQSDPARSKAEVEPRT